MYNNLKDSLKSASSWLTDVAAYRNGEPLGLRGAAMPMKDWNGSIRGEYRAATKEWDFFCPHWHGGQAIKALVMASEALGDSNMLAKAKFHADFLLKNSIQGGKDHGLLLAYENSGEHVCTSAILETVDGLFHLARATGENKYSQAAIDALEWVRQNAYIGKGVFIDLYNPETQKFPARQHLPVPRPLLDDAVFLTAWKISGEKAYRDIAIETAERLLADEEPSGNWIKYLPCRREIGFIHPRHAYWWGLPMLDVYHETGEKRFLECFKRSTEWYGKALRQDGGLFRATYTNFNSDSFGHATSGAACAAIVFLRYREETGDTKYEEKVERVLQFCQAMQFINPEDENMRGAILEKVTPPYHNTDANPYYLRDLATSFFLQAGSLYLTLAEKLDWPEPKKLPATPAMAF